MNILTHFSRGAAIALAVMIVSAATPATSMAQYPIGRCCLLADEAASQRWTTSTRGYQVSTMVHGGVASALVAANLMRPGRMGLSLAGVIAGSAGIGLATSHLANPHAPRGYAAANAVMAAASIGSAWRSARIARIRQTAVVPSAGHTSAVQLAPFAAPAAVGVSVSFR